MLSSSCWVGEETGDCGAVVVVATVLVVIVVVVVLGGSVEPRNEFRLELKPGLGVVDDRNEKRLKRRKRLRFSRLRDRDVEPEVE